MWKTPKLVATACITPEIKTGYRVHNLPDTVSSACCWLASLHKISKKTAIGKKKIN